MSAGKLDGVDIMSLQKGKYGDGLGLWLFKSGARTGSWVIRYSVNGKLKYQGVGGINDVSLAEARMSNGRWRAANAARRDADKAEALADITNAYFDKVDAALSTKQSGDDI